MDELARIRESLGSIEDPKTLLESFFAYAPLALQVYQKDGHCLLVNQAFLDLFGSGPPPEYNVLKDDIAEREGFLDLIHRAFAGETVHVPPHWYDPRNLKQVKVEKGNRVGVEVTLFPLRDQKKEVSHVAIVVKDVTATMLLRELNADLERRVADRTSSLEAANRELEAFNYSVSHDLGTPLRAIVGFGEVLIDVHGRSLGAEARDLVERIRGAARRMGLIISGLLDLSRLGREELKKERIDLTALAEDVLQELRTVSPRESMETRVEDGLAAEGDPRMIRVALQNLLENAWKFTAHARPGRVEFGSVLKDGVRAYRVRDNGAGFDMSHADKLFAAFSRLHSAAEFAGSGIGLATVSRIVSRHGGRIWAEGNVGGGAAFYFTLGS